MKYFLLNNNSYDSVGGQNIHKYNEYKEFSKIFSFQSYYCIKNDENLKNKIDKVLNQNKNIFVEVKISNIKFLSYQDQMT